MKKIELTQGQFALIDDKDFNLVSQHNWHVQKGYKTFYARTHIRKPDGTLTILLMHRLILNPPGDLQTDHKDGNGMNNRRSNLRACTPSQNLQNQRSKTGSSKFKGVCWSKSHKKWVARIKINSKTKNLGDFTDESEAAKCYNTAAEELFGEFAYLNL